MSIDFGTPWTPTADDCHDNDVQPPLDTRLANWDSQLDNVFEDMYETYGESVEKITVRYASADFLQAKLEGFEHRYSCMTSDCDPLGVEEPRATFEIFYRADTEHALIYVMPAAGSDIPPGTGPADRRKKNGG